MLTTLHKEKESKSLAMFSSKLCSFFITKSLLDFI